MQATEDGWIYSKQNMCFSRANKQAHWLRLASSSYNYYTIFYFPIDVSYSLGRQAGRPVSMRRTQFLVCKNKMPLLNRLGKG